MVSVDELFLETEVLQFSIKNGKFPHKKVNMTPIDDGSSNKQTEETPNESSFDENLIVIIVGSLTVVLVLILLVIFGMRLQKKRQLNTTSDK